MNPLDTFACTILEPIGYRAYMAKSGELLWVDQHGNLRVHETHSTVTRDPAL